MQFDQGSYVFRGTGAHQARLFSQAAQLARFGAWECDLATERLSWTDSVYDMFGLSVGTPLKRASILDLYCDESRREMELLRGEAIRSGRHISLDAKIRGKGGHARWIRLAIDTVRENGVATRIFGSKQDITAERETLDRLRAMAERDSLTGLANRGLFDAHYHEVISDGAGGISALVLIDLDRFKNINDAFGHVAGDECLRRVAMKLLRLFDDARLVARIGGDEFAVLLQSAVDEARIRRLLQRATAELARPVVVGDAAFDLSVSIGATILGRPHLRKPAHLFKEADEALYAAKAGGRNTFRVFGDVPAAQLKAG